MISGTENEFVLCSKLMNVISSATLPYSMVNGISCSLEGNDVNPTCLNPPFLVRDNQRLQLFIESDSDIPENSTLILMVELGISHAQSVTVRKKIKCSYTRMERALERPLHWICVITPLISNGSIGTLSPSYSLLGTTSPNYGLLGSPSPSYGLLGGEVEQWIELSQMAMTNPMDM